LSAIANDIPVARRSARAPQPSVRPWRTILLTSIALVSLAAALGVTVPQLRVLLNPAPITTLGVRRSPDGRLLGHYPYPEAPASQLVQVAPGLQVHRDAAEALLALQREAAAAGVDLRVISGFRSVALQNHLFFDVKSERNQSAAERAKLSAPPGFSEHSTGFSVDLGDGSRPGTNLKPVFESTPAFTWLQRNANRYHFRLSFPKDNRQGVSYEPWHWRFEGSAEALKMFESARRGAEIR
jgi:D-alanyl-D-alanine carboxypeptidase